MSELIQMFMDTSVLVMKKGRPFLLPISTTDSALILTSGTDPEHHIIKQHSNATELKRFGVHMNFMGTFALHAKMMRIKYNSMAQQLQKSAMSAAHSRIYCNTFYLPAVRYSLPVTSMTNTELPVQSLMAAVTLHKLGYNRRFPHAAAFAPTTVFGVGLVDLRIEQGL